jgi:hypothetical protein
MNRLWAAFWGALGAMSIEAWEIQQAIHRTRGLPWKQLDEPNLAAYVVAAVIRVGLGAVVAAAEAAGPVNPPASFSIGIGAPLLLERIRGGWVVGVATQRRSARAARHRGRRRIPVPAAPENESISSQASAAEPVPPLEQLVRSDDGI